MTATVAESHISTVLLTSDRAYKLLKPVDLGFADFTTVRSRLAAIDEELRLNRRMAPDVYLGTADVHEDGELVDRMLVMRRMDHRLRLETLLAGLPRTGGGGEPQVPGELASCIDAVVRSVAALHAAAPPVRGAAAHMATRDAVESNWSDNLAVIEPHVGEVLDPGEFSEVRRRALDYTEGCDALFDRRIEDGWIRDGHGDLRAEDIFCEPDGPRVLDCLAFSEDLRVADVLADVGFLAMDLVHLGFPDLAGAALRLYGELTAETHPASLAQHYIAYRAHVRTKVCCLQLEQGDLDKAGTARSMHALALDRLRLATPVLVIVGGAPGTGKSTLARGLSEEAGLCYVGSDVVRKELAGISPHSSARAAVGEGIYEPGMTERTYAELLRRAEVLLAHGEPVVLDASFTAGRHREAAREVARRRRCAVRELRCAVDPAVAARRAGERVGDPSDADETVARSLAEEADPWPEALRIETGSGADRSLRAAMDSLGRRTAAP
ncbi:MAG: AAA family ATPase [Microthrixaceae bacterium]